MSPSAFVPGAYDAYTTTAPRYHVLEYICNGPTRVPASPQGTVTVQAVLEARPARCRYALLQVPGQTPVLVADLYDVEVGTGGYALLQKYWVYPDLDTARAAIMLSYETP
jgi:hypothetical protein